MLGGLAATAVVAFVVVGAIDVLNNVGGGFGAASAPESRSAIPRAIPEPGAGSSRSRPDAGPAGNPVLAPAGVKVAYGGLANRATARVLSSRADLTRRNIARIVSSEISYSLSAPTFNGAATPGTSQPSSAAGKVGPVSVGQISRCLSAVGPGNGVLLVEIAHYRGKPAMIIVSNVVNNPAGKFYRVTVAGLACSAARPDVLARITVPKPR